MKPHASKHPTNKPINIAIRGRGREGNGNEPTLQWTWWTTQISWRINVGSSGSAETTRTCRKNQNPCHTADHETCTQTPWKRQTSTWMWRPRPVRRRGEALDLLSWHPQHHTTHWHLICPHPLASSKLHPMSRPCSPSIQMMTIHQLHVYLDVHDVLPPVSDQDQKIQLRSRKVNC